MTREYPRLNYDDIAGLYDDQTFRLKAADPHLLAFLASYTGHTQRLSVLDLGCGTGNQLVANRLHVPGAWLVGLDLSRQMLRRACAKAGDILWVQADSSLPPFAANSFDYISNQFSLHHVLAKEAMIRAVYRLLRPGGRFVMTNLYPHDMPGWLYYRYFPDALAADLQDFPTKEALTGMCHRAGLANIRLDLDYQVYEEPLLKFAETVQRRDSCSQLLTISYTAYETGLRRLQQDLQHATGAPVTAVSEFCLLTLQAEKL